MSEGTDTDQPLSGDETTSIEEIRKKYPDTRDREELKTWMYNAIAQREVYGLTWTETAERFGKSESYMASLGNSPAGKRFREKIQSLKPEEIAELTLKAASVDATQDFMMALGWAKEARDYKAVRKMTKDLLEFADVGSKGKDSGGGGQTIVLNLDASSLESPDVETSYETLEAEVVEEDPGG